MQIDKAPASIKQGGFSLIELLIVVAIIGFLAPQFFKVLSDNALRQAATNSERAVVQITESLYAHYAAEGQTWEASFPSDIATLESRGYLPFFTNRNGNGYPFTFTPITNGTTSSTGLPITVGGRIDTQVATIKDADLLVAKFGSSASSTTAASGAYIVSIGINTPVAHSSHVPLLDRAGIRPVLGTIEFNSGAHIDLNGNDIQNARRVDAEEVVAVEGEFTDVLRVSNSNNDAALLVDLGSVRGRLTVGELVVNDPP